MPVGHDISSGAPDLDAQVYVSTSDQVLNPNSEAIVEDVFECAANYALELAAGSLFSIQTTTAWSNFIAGSDASGAFLEIVR